jgi:coenzyme F420 hydrogenase subunit delta
MNVGRYQKDCLIFGCGNPLFGDDGFGPAVIEYLENQCHLPATITALDVGTSIRDILFDIILAEQKPRRMIIIDAVDVPDRSPGEIFEIEVDQIAPAKIGDYSLHQFPTTNMLKEIREQTEIDVRLLVVQITGLPPEVRPGLSSELEQAIPAMGRRVLELAAPHLAEGIPS